MMPTTQEYLHNNLLYERVVNEIILNEYEIEMGYSLLMISESLDRPGKWMSLTRDWLSGERGIRSSIELQE